MQENRGLLSAVSYLEPQFARAIELLPSDNRQNIDEIRLRAGLPFAVTVSGGVRLVGSGGALSERVQSDTLIVSHDNVAKTFLRLCGNSVFAHEQEIKNGYIALPYGLRAGVCGRFSESGELAEVSSLNIRIARQVRGCANALLPHLSAGGMLIAGPPCSGKTTLLREAVRCLSSGEGGQCCKVAVIDSRGEISGGGANDLGQNTDVIRIADKARGSEMALRTLFPDILAFDEIGNACELESVSESFNAGVRVLVTAHAGSVQELMRRQVTRTLLQSGAIENVALLQSVIGAPPQIFSAREVARKLCG